MDLEARKLSLIDWVLHLKDENALKQLEKLYNENKLNSEMISNEGMNSRHIASVKDIENGNIYSHEDVKSLFSSKL